MGDSGSFGIMDHNIVFNPNFELGLRGWQSNSCTAFVSRVEGQSACVITGRKETWQGLEQELTCCLQENVKYSVKATVKLSTDACVKATLRLETHDNQTTYLPVGQVRASSAEWSRIRGNFSLDIIPKRVTFYIEGPPATVDIVVIHVDVRPCPPTAIAQPITVESDRSNTTQEIVDYVLRNTNFEQGLECWYGKCCNLRLVNSSMLEKDATPKPIALATNRTSGWQGIEQDVSGRIQGKKKYEVSAQVRIGAGTPPVDVLATLWIKDGAQKEHYITLGRATATSTGWVQLKGSVLLNSTPEKAAAYLEGPSAGVDLLISSFSIFSIRKAPPIRPIVKDPNFGVNIVENSSLSKGLDGWRPLGSCSLTINTGAPFVLPKLAQGSLSSCMPLTGLYVTATNRKHIWEGPSQNITGKIKLFVTYQVSAWVRIGHGGMGPQKINVTLGVDGRWVNGGEVEGDPNAWKEVAGSFRCEKEPENVLLYVQGPSANVDLKVAYLTVFAVDRTARFEMLKAQTDKIRKQDAVIRVTNKSGAPLSQTMVNVKQKMNSFPLGCCINSYSVENDDYTSFFFKNFNWAVFENELKWYWTEKERGKLNYKEAEELCALCERHGIPMRGHCIFWEVEEAVQDWVKELGEHELAMCVQNRVIDLVSRFRGKFEHYDVNNEMLHGSFYMDRLGAEILPYMFKLAQQFDPKPKLFVNDYHVEDGYDAYACPEKYIHQIQELQAMDAPVGGIGIQGHITYPVGTIISDALDKLAMLRLPIWFTEVDVESSNEFLRGEDFEVVLREAYAHPAVEGVMLWGFMESAIHRANAHLVDADGTVNEAGKTFLALKQEWQTRAGGLTDDMGCFCFRGYHGSYTVMVQDSHGKEYQREFELCKGGDDAMVVGICL